MKLDQIGFWSEIKLEIIKKYASAYTTVLSKQPWCKGYVYIDAFAGAGMHISKTTGGVIQGSPLNALEVQPSFTEYYFIDLDEERVNLFEGIAKENPRVHAYQGDCNEILVNKIFPKLNFATYKRALCILDPYKINIEWETIKKAADLKTIDMFLNFSIMDVNRNILVEDLLLAKQEDIDRMNTFWGDESWKELLYIRQKNLFGKIQQIKIDTFEKLALGFEERLKKVAGFKYVPEPILMRNTKNGPLYYLYFASQEGVANRIVNDIFDKYRMEL
jgi:three-Cys-motif partner protein